jgi:hypothetical protein
MRPRIALALACAAPLLLAACTASPNPSATPELSSYSESPSSDDTTFAGEGESDPAPRFTEAELKYLKAEGETRMVRMPSTWSRAITRPAATLANTRVRR